MTQQNPSQVPVMFGGRLYVLTLATWGLQGSDAMVPH
jgi:hypothetical protein